MSALLREVEAASDVPETLSALEEIWQPFLDEETGARRIRAGASALIAGRGRPLSDKTLGRVALLRGAGNAIVPEVAAEFIRAVMEGSP